MNLILLILSMLIYLSYGISNFILIVISIIFNFIISKFLKTKYKKIILTFSIFINTTILLFFKYFPYTSSIINTLGISYYMLQIISYLIDVYKSKYEAETNFLYFALYIFFIPHLFIGPIIRYDDMKKQIITKKTFNINNFSNGALRIAWGFSKKIIIANRISILIETITSNPEIYNGVFAFFAMILYSIELYSDFSGGIDIVLGISKIIGFEFKENFDSPYYSETIKEFWRKWHISLGSWLKDYIYIPLGGSRCSKVRKIFNLLITFLISGLWHGINYIFWGLFNGIFVLLGNVYKTEYKILNRLITFIIVSILWSFFIWNTSIKLSFTMILSIFTKFQFSIFIKNILNLGLTLGDFIVLIISTIILFIFDGNKEKIIKKLKSKSFEKKLTIFCTICLLIFVFGIYGIGFNTNDFIYSKF